MVRGLYFLNLLQRPQNLGLSTATKNTTNLIVSTFIERKLKKIKVLLSKICKIDHNFTQCSIVVTYTGLFFVYDFLPFLPFLQTENSNKFDLVKD